MKLFFLKLVAGVVMYAGAACALSADEKMTASSRETHGAEECQIGAMVKQIKQAISAADGEVSLNTIAKHGTDSRYYVMIRGWLREELAGVKSQLESAKDDASRTAFERKVEFLKKAIRRIDLE